MKQSPKAEETKNVYAELGFPDAAEMLVKAQLVVRIAKILREQFRGISEAKLMDCLVQLGCDVKIVIGQKRKAAASRVEVVAA